MIPSCILALTLAGLAAVPEFPRKLVAFTPHETNPVFKGSGPGHWDERIRERGWILYEDELYHLWYTGYSGAEDAIKKLGYATSPDGIIWTRYPNNPIYDDHWVEDMIVVKHGDTYYMFAEGENDQAHLLTSSDRIHWTRQGVLDVRMVNGDPIPPGPFGTPCVYFEDGTWYLFYERNDAAIWLATSMDMNAWTHVQDDPVLVPGPAGYDAGMIAINHVVKYMDRYYAYYHGLVLDSKPEEWTTCIAASDDLIHWTKYPGNPILEDNKSSGIIVYAPVEHRLFTMHPAVCMHIWSPPKD